MGRLARSRAEQLLGGGLQVLTHGPEVLSWKRSKRRRHVDLFAVGIKQHQRGKRLLEGVRCRGVLRPQRRLRNVLYLESLPRNLLRETHDLQGTQGRGTAQLDDRVLPSRIF